MGSADPAEDPKALVLVVEDNEPHRYILRSWLERAGHTVVEAGDGTDALCLLDERGRTGRPLPELALVDVHLPDMSGFEVCERIKGGRYTAGMPVIHVSATAIAAADRTQGLDRGADAYLTEPIAPGELLATVSATLRYTRARIRAEQLAVRLGVLNEVTLEIYGADQATALAAATARGARRLFGADAVVLARSPHSDAVYCTCVGATGPARTRQAPAGALDELAPGALANRTGVVIVQAPAEQWPDWPDAADLAGAAEADSGDAGSGGTADGSRWAGSDSSAGSADPAENIDLARTIAADQTGPEEHTAAAPPRLGAGLFTVAAARTKRGRPPVLLALDLVCEADEDRKLLSQLAQACALALEALRSYAEEHALAVTLQRALLPARLARADGVELAVSYLPATAENEIGGDFYESVETDAGLLLVVGDVAGHSMDAAIVMGGLRHTLLAYALDGHPPHMLLQKLDHLMYGQWPGWTASVCLALIAPDRRSVQFANAGHIPPLLITPGDAQFVREHGPMLGCDLPQPAAVRRELSAHSGVLLVTDGLIESRRVDLATSLEQLRSAAAQAPGRPQDLCQSLLATFRRPQEDDIVVFAARIESTIEQISAAVSAVENADTGYQRLSTGHTGVG
jgi:DNA-binding response OmpR family regulator/serine phosphatase RsbU (regulator of sigma subunit)